MLPWVDEFLINIQAEYSKKLPIYHFATLDANDMKYIHSTVQQSSDFDKLNLKKEMMEAYEKKKADGWKAVSSLGEILYIGTDKPAVEAWWRIIRLMSTKPVRILIFAHPSLRKMPEKGKPVEASHINGGYAMPCDPRTIVIYRQEEIARVMIHELFHASCSDPYHRNTPNIEADTEAWAEIVLCGMAAKGNSSSWRRLMREQINYSLRQAATLRDNHGVNTDADYAWRYTIGRLDVWRGLGLDVPEPPSQYTVCESLRLTVCEPAK